MVSHELFPKDKGVMAWKCCRSAILSPFSVTRPFGSSSSRSLTPGERGNLFFYFIICSHLPWMGYRKTPCRSVQLEQDVGCTLSHNARDGEPVTGVVSRRFVLGQMANSPARDMCTATASPAQGVIRRM